MAQEKRARELEQKRKQQQNIECSKKNNIDNNDDNTDDGVVTPPLSKQQHENFVNVARQSLMKAIEDGSQPTTIFPVDENGVLLENLPQLPSFVNENRVCESIRSVFYLPDFIDAEQELALCRGLQTLADQTFHRISGRDVLMLGGVPFEQGMQVEELPKLFTPLLKQLEPIFGGVTPNHILVNRYDAGKGIMPHTDGPLYVSRVCIVSLLAPAEFCFGSYIEPENQPRQWQTKEKLQIEPKSLLVFQDDAYLKLLHTIQDSKSAHTSQKRISLTIRVVNKVLEK